MRILQVHNRYVAGGGEEAVVELERTLLERYGHAVERLETSNRDVRVDTVRRRARAAVDTVWSRWGYRVTADAVRRHRPDLVHIHNTFQRLSLSACWAAHRAGVPVVMTLHNYRLLCVNQLLLRAGAPCQRCVGRLPWRAVAYRCYRDAAAPSAALATMQVLHRALGTLRRPIELIIVLSEFARRTFERGGLPADRLRVKPNFTFDDERPPAPRATRPRRIAFVGRLSSEKGVDLLIDAWRMLAPTNAELMIVGDGPERDGLARRAQGLERLTWGGWLERGPMLDVVDASRFVVLPSRIYEGFPVVVPEAFARSTPLIAPRHGPFEEIVGPEARGLSFRPGDVGDLAATLGRALAMKEPGWQSMSRAARDAYEQRYSPDVNYRALLAIYESACERRRGGRAGALTG